MEITKDDIAKIVDIAEAEWQEEQKPENKVKDLKTRLDTAIKIIAERQQTIDELKEALRKTSFQTADKIPTSPPVIGNNDIFNLSVNKSYFILR